MAEVDPKLKCPSNRVDMVVGEVKEGRAEINRAVRNRRVLQAVLVRFGCCKSGHVNKVIENILSQGWSDMPNGHRVRVLAFGSQVETDAARNYHAIELGHVLEFLERYLGEYWDTLRHAQYKHPAFGFLMTLEKARRGAKDRSAGGVSHDA